MSNDLMTLFTFGIAFAALVLAIINAVRQGKNIDAATADKLADMHKPETLDRLKEAYQNANETTRQLVGAVSAILQLVAPLTPGIKADDAARELLKDIQTPGIAGVGVPGDTPASFSGATPAG